MSADVLSFPAGASEPHKPERRSAGGPVELTVKRIERFEPRDKRYLVGDAKTPGLAVRVFPSGVKVFYARGRLGGGRAAKKVEVRIGSCDTFGLADARSQAKEILAELRKGRDPRIRIEAQLSLDALIDRYEKRLVSRGVVKRADMISALKRGLRKYLAQPAADLTRKQVIALLDKLEAQGKAGAAQYMRKTLTAMLNWAVGADHITHNVMGGYRRERSTKAQSAAMRPKTTLTTEDDLQAFWEAAGTVQSEAFRDYLRFLLMAGTRRTETALMEWSQVSLDDGCWVIPAEQTKMGREHTVYLGPMSQSLLSAQPRYNATDLVFPGRRLRPMSGWSKLLAPVKSALEDQGFAFHALRRTYRTGLSELGVEHDVAEMMVAHKRSDLHGRYDRSTLEAKRRDAQEQWEAHLAGVLGK